MTDGVVVVIQARTGSSRYPGKVLADLGGQPMLAHQVARLAPLPFGPLVLATSDSERDDAVAELGALLGVDVVRGPEADVLSRFAAVLDCYRPQTLVRLTGDCPLSDPMVVARTVERHESAHADYTSNVLPRSFPKGLDVEVIAGDALRAAADEASDPSEREHVTPFVYRRPERFRLANLLGDEDHAHRNWSVDTAEDLARVRAIVACVADSIQATWREMLPCDLDPGCEESPFGFRAHRNPEPGSAPWVRSWIVTRSGIAIGTAALSVGAGVVHQDVWVDDAIRAEATEAFESFLGLDQQRAIRPGPTT